MSEQFLIAIIGIIGVIVGGILSSIPIYFQEQRNQKRWLIEKKIEYIKELINEINQYKKYNLKGLQNLLKGEKYGNSGDIVSSVPMEVFDAFNKHLSNGKTMFRDIPELKKQEIIIDVATALERKKNDLHKSIKELLS